MMLLLFAIRDDELETLFAMVKYVLLGANVILFLTAAFVYCTASPLEHAASASTPDQAKRALIVTAHPDDESLFFLPLVHSLQTRQKTSDECWQTHVLCLSRGNDNGLGSIRENELKACATYIGLSMDHVQALEDPKLQDGMKMQWDVTHIAAIVATYVKKNEIDAVFTFDDYGVSGHPNHIATFYGVQQAIRELQEICSANSVDEDAKETKVVRGWALESTNIVRKYMGLLDTTWSYWLSRQSEDKRRFVFLFRPMWNYNAMALHQSQFVWYRRLFVAFSRYTFINTFRPLQSVGSTVLSAKHKKAQ